MKLGVNEKIQQGDKINMINREGTGDQSQQPNESIGKFEYVESDYVTKDFSGRRVGKTTISDVSVRKRVLLVCVNNKRGTLITHDVIYRLFVKYGEILKILIFEKCKIWRFFVEMETLEQAERARDALNNHTLFEDGSKMTVHYAKVDQIVLQNNNSGGVDYRELKRRRRVVDYNNYQIEGSGTLMQEKYRKNSDDLVEDNNCFKEQIPQSYEQLNKQVIPQIEMNGKHLPFAKHRINNTDKHRNNSFDYSELYRSFESVPNINQKLSPEKSEMKFRAENISIFQGFAMEQNSEEGFEEDKQFLEISNQSTKKNQENDKDEDDNDKDKGVEKRLAEDLSRLGLNPSEQVEDKNNNSNNKQVPNAFNQAKNLQNNNNTSSPQDNMNSNEQLINLQQQYQDKGDEPYLNPQFLEGEQLDIERIDPSQYVNPLFLLENKKSRVLYVRGLEKRTLTTKKLYNLFSNFGNIELILYFIEKRYSLIQFETQEDATTGKEYLDNLKVEGIQMRIFYSNYESIKENQEGEKLCEIWKGEKNTSRFRNGKQISVNPVTHTLHVSNLKQETCKQDIIFEKFSPYGLIEAFHPIITSNKFMCHVKFSSIEEAANALVNLHEEEILGRKMHISFTRSRISPMTTPDHQNPIKNTSIINPQSAFSQVPYQSASQFQNQQSIFSQHPNSYNNHPQLYSNQALQYQGQMPQYSNQGLQYQGQIPQYPGQPPSYQQFSQFRSQQKKATEFDMQSSNPEVHNSLKQILNDEDTEYISSNENQLPQQQQLQQQFNQQGWGFQNYPPSLSASNQLQIPYQLIPMQYSQNGQTVIDQQQQQQGSIPFNTQGKSLYQGIQQQQQQQQQQQKQQFQPQQIQGQIPKLSSGQYYLF